MQIKTLLFTLLTIITTVKAQENSYQITVDFNTVKNDMVKVVVNVPELKNNKIEYVMPSVIPGSYDEKDFGRFISKFKALDKEGNEISFKKKGENIFVIKDKENKLDHLEYWVRDTWDADLDDNYVFQPGGTNIEKNENFTINHQGFYGYFEGDIKLPYEVKYLHPKGMYAATSLDVQQSEDNAIITAKDYVEIVDNPVMISLPDTASFYAGDMKINVSIYTPNKIINVDSIVSYLKPTGDALAQFFGKLPVDEYDFIMYFADESSPNGASPSYGALEHSYGSFYFIPEIPTGEYLKQIIIDIASHEFLHILTPLNIHAEEIENFNFRYPKMSKHLWLYEGVTEYFAHLVQVQSGITDEFQLMEVMSEKIEYASDFKDVSFTKMSEQILKKKYNKMYSNVYDKGALMAFLLDIRIRELTEHKKDLRSVLLELAKKYGPSKPFKDDEIIDEIVSIVHPKLKDYFDAYVEGNKPLPYVDYFNKLGWKYEAHGEREMGTFKLGKGSLGATEDGHLFVAMDIENPLKLKPNDVLISVEGDPLSVENIEPLYNLIMVSDKEREITVVVERNGKEVTLSAKPELEKITIDYFIYGENPEKLSPRQSKMRNGILNIEE